MYALPMAWAEQVGGSDQHEAVHPLGRLDLSGLGKRNHFRFWNGVSGISIKSGAPGKENFTEYGDDLLTASSMKFHAAWPCGDSGSVCGRRGTLRQVTGDHQLCSPELVRQKQMTQEEAELCSKPMITQGHQGWTLKSSGYLRGPLDRAQKALVCSDGRPI